ncbi:MAG: 3'-5' exonuclease [Lachnospiraceae bacterium]|nr:3'-5' exonuclease [Lachnospiraceae bacterium]
MDFVVLDFEFNQPYSFKSGLKTVLNPLCPFEIIQIGAVKLNSDFNELDKLNIFVRPQIYTRIHPFVERMTGLNIANFENASFFQEIYPAFAKFVGKDSILCTWGIDDIKALYKNILFYDLDPNIITNKYINVQKHASYFLKTESGSSIGLKSAVELLNIPEEVKFHDALNDAAYTAKIFAKTHITTIEPNIFNTDDLNKRRKRATINKKALISFFEKDYGRRLTPEECKMIKKAYKLGKNKVFEKSGQNN